MQFARKSAYCTFGHAKAGTAEQSETTIAVAMTTCGHERLARQADSDDAVFSENLLLVA